MATSLVLTVIGEDKPGLVELLSSTVTTHDGNWLESRMSRMAGKFAGIVRVEIPESSVAAFTAALASLAARGLKVTAEPTATATATATAAVSHPALRLEVIGTDHPGIVRDIARALSGRNVNVEELSTECTSAPMSGEPLFRATARLRLPEGVSVEQVRRDLEQVAHSLMVDVTLDPETGRE